MQTPSTQFGMRPKRVTARVIPTPVNLRRTTIHDPQSSLPPKMRCIGIRPYCNESHYYSVPAIDTLGTFKVSEIIGDETAVQMAVLAKWLEKGSATN